MKPRFQPGSLILCILELAIGVILLASPLGLTSLILLVAGILFAAGGCLQMILYLRLDPLLASQGRRFSAGLALIGAGLFLIIRRDYVVSASLALSLFYGLLCVAAGLEKAQWCTDLIRLKVGNWIFPAVGALMSLVGGIVILCNPFSSQTALWRFTGILLVVVSLLDFFSVFKGAGRKRTSYTVPNGPQASHGKSPYAQQDSFRDSQTELMPVPQRPAAAAMPYSSPAPSRPQKQRGQQTPYEPQGQAQRQQGPYGPQGQTAWQQAAYGPQGQAPRQQAAYGPQGKTPRQQATYGPQGQPPRQQAAYGPQGQTPRQQAQAGPQGQPPRQQNQARPQGQPPRQQAQTAGPVSPQKTPAAQKVPSAGSGQTDTAKPEKSSRHRFFFRKS